MPLPENVGFGTVTGRIIDSNGNPVEGSVRFVPSPNKLLNVTASPPVTILPRPTRVSLASGTLPPTQLVATDDPDNNPSDWTYRVEFNLTDAALDPFSFELPEGQTVDLTTVAPVGSSNGALITRGMSAYEVAVANGFEGTEQEWLDSLGGGGGGEQRVFGGRIFIQETEPADPQPNDVWIQPGAVV